MTKKLLLLSTFLLVGLLLAGCTDQVGEEKPVSDEVSPTGQEQQYEEDLDENDASQIPVTSILDRAESIDFSKYDIVTTMPNGEQQEVSVWWKGDKMRAETTIDMAGQELDGVYLLDRDEKTSYAYSPDQGRAISMDYGTTKEEVGDNPKSQSSEIQAKDFSIVKEEVWDGKECVVVKYVSEDGNETRTWVWKEHGLPVRFVSEDSQGETVTELRNIEFTNISDAKFELPEGVQVIDIPTGINY